MTPNRLIRLVAVLGAGAVIAAGCGGSSHKSTAPKLTPTPRKTTHHRAARKPTVCPLTGVRPKNGRIPSRPALAIKVENLPLARPQAGLNGADIVYEEPVEGDITRFIVVFQCGGSDRVEPVRSGRLVDPDILVQFGHPLMAYAGGIDPVIAKVDSYGIIDVNYRTAAGGAYYRDPNRSAPHNLVTTTAGLWAFGHGPAPAGIFTYSVRPPAGGRAPYAHINFSQYSNVFWKYVAARHGYLRYYDGFGDPATLMDGSQISATNVVVQYVRIFPSPFVEDPTGTHENYVVVTGTGPAVIYRNGLVIAGKWWRPNLHAITQFFDRRGHRLALAPGRTWVELLPLGRPVYPT